MKNIELRQLWLAVGAAQNGAQPDDRPGICMSWEDKKIHAIYNVCNLSFCIFFSLSFFFILLLPRRSGITYCEYAIHATIVLCLRRPFFHGGSSSNSITCLRILPFVACKRPGQRLSRSNRSPVLSKWFHRKPRANERKKKETQRTILVKIESKQAEIWKMIIKSHCFIFVLFFFFSVEMNTEQQICL